MPSLQPYHTFSLAVQASHIIEATTVAELHSAWQQAQAQNLPVLLLGEGSNVLFLTDFQGTVIINRLKGIKHTQDDNFHYLSVKGGENWHNLVKWSVEQGIAGLENLALIPGCVGSAPIQNIGAYGVEFKDVCHTVKVLNLITGEQFSLRAEECQFGYRESIFKQQYREHYAIIEVTLKLAKNWQPVLNYGSLTQFDKHSVTPQMIFTEVCHIRQSKLPDPTQLGNAGSFFKNPVISTALFQQLQTQSPTIPHYPQADGTVKLAAGWLIDQCGLKGKQIGGAAVHQQQALVIINKQQATGKDIIALAKYIRQQVADKFNVYLQPEVRFIGATGEVDSEQAIA